MSDPDELVDLSGVTEHPGWHRIKALLQTEYGPSGRRYVEELERAVNSEDRTRATENLQLVIKVRKEIEGFFRGIEARVRTLQEARVPTVNPSRRGTL